MNLETCSKNRSWSQFTAEDIVQHTRQPVYFSDTVERIATRLPSAICLEAGSASPIVRLIRRSLGSSSSSNNLIAINLGFHEWEKSLVNAAIQLWMMGFQAHYWPFQGPSDSQHTWCDIPPHQFEKAQHWIEYKLSIESKQKKSDAAPRRYPMPDWTHPNLFWFDLVFELLEGWWLFNNGRKHVLADEARWQHCLSAAGFEWIDWSDSPSEQSDLLQVITASPPAGNGSMLLTNSNQDLQETVVFKKVDDLGLLADTHHPSEVADPNKELPVALMIHGGGHITLPRKDIRPEQTAILLKQGFLPLSINYWLCPETTIRGGPVSL